MTALDRDMLEAFLPEFLAEVSRLGAATEAAGAARALDQLRAMAAALGARSLTMLLGRAALLLDPPDLPALREAAAGIAAQAKAIGAAGQDLALPEAAPMGEAPAPPPAATPPIDAELLAAFLPEFTQGCDRLGAATEPAVAQRAVGGCDAMAASLGIASLREMLRAVPLDPFEPSVLAPHAAGLARQARAIVAAGHDLPPATLARRRVLVVDDSPMMRRLVRDILLIDPAFEIVGEAPDGRAALDAMRRLEPDLTMLDIEMPELDGMGVLRAWSLRGPGAVVIVSSAARPGSATAIEARGLGAAGIVGKPSGALSPDLRQRQGEALLRVARRATGLGA